eukprot:6423031-Alexandrium_andersonii.AAC.1
MSECRHGPRRQGVFRWHVGERSWMGNLQTQKAAHQCPGVLCRGQTQAETLAGKPQTPMPRGAANEQLT